MSELTVAVVGAQGRLGAFACETVEATDGLTLVARYDQGDDWPASIVDSGAAVAFEATRAGLGLEHGLALLEAGLRPVIGTSGVDADQNGRLDARARERASAAWWSPTSAWASRCSNARRPTSRRASPGRR